MNRAPGAATAPAAAAAPGAGAAPAPSSDVAHLTPERWEHATRRLLAKALAESAHERLLTPERVTDAPDDAPDVTPGAPPSTPSPPTTAARPTASPPGA